MGWGVNQYRLVRIPVKSACTGYYLRWYYNGWHYWFFKPGQIALNTEGEKYNTLSTQELRIGTGQVTTSQIVALRTILNTREVYLLNNFGWADVRVLPGSVDVKNNYIDGYEMEITIRVGSCANPYIIPVAPPIIDPPIPDPDICELPCIGTQIWMCKNYDSLFPGSRVYNDDEANRAIYGGLYTYSQVMASGFVPAGWHVPTLAEWQTLIAYAVTGIALKEVGHTHWKDSGDPANDGIDTYDFTALPSGLFDTSSGLYLSLTEYAWFLTASSIDATTCSVIQMRYDTATAVVGVGSKNQFFAVRLIKDIGCPAIPNLYGLLYNWFTVDTGKLAPTGWHVPTVAEYDIMITYLGGNVIALDKVKETGTTHWSAPNTATNSSGFTAVGNGERDASNGAFYSLYNVGALLTSGFDVNNCFIYIDVRIDHMDFNFYGEVIAKRWGMGVRCILDGVDPADPGSVTDADGNVYPTVKIGTQVYMAQNLRVTKLNDNTPIPEVTGAAAWMALSTPGRCWYNNTP